MAIWRIEMLGGLRAIAPDRVVDKFPTQKTASLLAYLATFSRSSVSREVLAEMFWPDADPESQRHSLRVALSRLRSHLGPDHPIEAGRHSVRLDRSRFVTDVGEFESAVARGDGSLARRIYTGIFLPGFYDEWILVEQSRLDQIFEDLTEGGSSFPETLPRVATSFLGRSEERSHIRQELRPGRIVTLTGPGGIGKTRLAAATARDHGQAIWVSLADLSEASQAVQSIREALRLPLPAPGFAVEDMVVRELNELGPVLLVLDNAEQLVGKVFSEVVTRLAAIDDLSLMVTCRVPLGLAEEFEVPIGPLVEADAAALFRERALHTRPDFGASDESVLEIARRFGGMPLALELAAARIGVQDVRDLITLDWIEDSEFGETFGISKRQRSLDSVLRSSLKPLDDKARKAFAQLSVFRGGFDTTAAATVAGANPSILEYFRRLALIVAWEEPDGTLRFRMPEPLRDIASSEGPDAHIAHAEYFADWIEANRADDLPPPPYGFATRLARQERERENIRAALETCEASEKIQDRETGLRIVAAYWTHWYVRSEGIEMERWATSLLNGPGVNTNPLIQASARLALGLALRERGAREAWATEILGALEVLVTGPRDRNLAFALHLRGFSLADHGQWSEAELAYMKAETVWKELGDERNYSISRHNRAMVAVEVGDLDKAEALVGEAMELFRLHQSTYLAIGFATVGSIRRARGDFAGASAALAEAVEVHHRLGYMRGWAQNERDLGLCLAELGKNDEARPWIESSIAAFRKVGDRHGEATALAALAQVTGERWHADEARGVIARHQLPRVGELLENL